VTDPRAPRRLPRQPRGERRLARILDAAAAVFAEAGYEGATTNAIAARAETSIGTLYRFFPHKDALAQALADRFLADLRALYDAALRPEAEVVRLPLPALLDRIIDPLAAFNVAHPGFTALFVDARVSASHGAAVAALNEGAVRRLDDILAARAPDADPTARQRHARVAVRIVKALLPPATAPDADAAERAAMLDELKVALRAYIGASFPDADQTPAPAPVSRSTPHPDGVPVSTTGHEDTAGRL